MKTINLYGDDYETEWEYEAWFQNEVDYFLIENVPEGYSVRYENVGKHAGETDRLYNGGTMVNYEVPKTGDTANPLLWIGSVLAGVGALAGLVIAGRRRKHGK